MDIVIIAMIILGSALLGIIISAFARYYLQNKSIPYINSRHIEFFTREYTSGHPVYRCFRSIGIANPLYLLSLLFIITINTTVLAISKDRVVLISRSNEMFLINLVLLLLFGRSNVFAKRIPISQQFRDFIHAWLGVVAIAECVIRLVADLSALRFDTYRLKSTPSIAGLVSSISLAVLGVFSLPFTRRHVFELFLSTHLALTVVVILATILYLAPLDFSQPSNILLIVAGSLHIILIAIRIGIPLWDRDHIRVFEENEVLKADNTLPELERLHSGLFKSQPQIQYEKSLLTENYDNYILFASGIGIIAHLGYIEALIERLQKNRDESGIKKISLFWEIDEFEPWKYGVDKLGALLNRDNDRCKNLTSGPKYTGNERVFRYSMFNKHPLTNMFEGSSKGGRQHWIKQPLNVTDILQKELKMNKTLVSVCANFTITDKIRNVQGAKKENFVLHTYEFYPEDASTYELLTVPQ